MIDATGNPQTVLLLGATSEIGLAIVWEYLAKQPLKVILAGRPGPAREAAAQELLVAGARSVDVLDFDATATDTHPGVIDAAWAIADVDVAVVAFGVLGDAEEAWQDHALAVRLAQVNYTGGVSVGVLLGQRMKAQGYGQVIALSSVAGEFVRRSNFVYGSTKAGFDGFYRLLGQALEEFGPKVLVVRPGQVKTKMLAGIKPRGAVAKEVVARRVVDAARDGTSLIWVPPLFRFVMLVLKHVPDPILRRLPI